MVKSLNLDFLRERSGVHVKVRTSAQRYLGTLKKDEAVFLLWDVDGVTSESGWTAFAYSETQFHPKSKRPFVTNLCGVKIVVPDGRRVGDLDGRVLTYEGGRLQLT